jgi:alkanesulfonate monooxygenase SsuD/methylene tetrahydromethanopterin reductase-like flavin-dependent oxidoreductase (luciferase family)
VNAADEENPMDMRLGFFTQPVHPPTRSYRDVLREDREAVVLADRLGFREAFIGEHVADSAETITSSLAFIASLADRCPSIAFGTGVLPLPNYHPVMAAAQVAMVDHLVEGRLLLGVGPGVPPDAEALGDLGTDRGRKLREAIDQMIALWTRPAPYRLEGEFYRSDTGRFLNPDIGVGIVVKPLQDPHPPIVVTSIRPDSAGPYTAGARDWTGISATYVGAHVVRSHVEKYSAGRESAGLAPGPTGWRLARSIFVADDEATAARFAHDERGPYGFYFRVMMTKLAAFGGLGLMRDHAEQPDSELSLERTLERLVIAGTPESVADQLLKLRSDVGSFGTLLYTGHDWADPDLSRRSMELMANEVWPRVVEGSVD